MNASEVVVGAWKYMSEFNRQKTIRKAFIQKLLPTAIKVIIDNFKSQPNAEIMHVMESDDRVFNDEIIEYEEFK